MGTPQAWDNPNYLAGMRQNRRRPSIQQLPLEGGRATASGVVMIAVKAQKGSLVYQDIDLAVPVPEDDFIPVELTPTIAQAIADGDLIKSGKPFLNEEGGPKPRGARRGPKGAPPGSSASQAI